MQYNKNCKKKKLSSLACGSKVFCGRNSIASKTNFAILFFVTGIKVTEMNNQAAENTDY